MEVVTDAGNTIELFENDIELYLQQFQEEQGIDDLRQIPQAVWNGALRYINRNVFRNNPELLKSHDNIMVDSNTIPSNYNRYNYDIVLQLVDYYIYICSLYNKEVSIVGFSNLTGIDTDTINEWGNNSNRLSTVSSAIYKKLITMREESLANKLADGKQNPVGVIAMLNRHYGWASPYTADARKQQGALSASELPKLGGRIVAEIDTINE